MAIWALVGGLGLGVSLWLFAATNRPDVTKIERIHIRRLALARVFGFAFVALNAPIVYFMFSVPTDGDWGARVQTGIPFWAILVAGIIVVVANAAVLVLTLSVVWRLKRGT